MLFLHKKSCVPTVEYLGKHAMGEITTVLYSRVVDHAFHTEITRKTGKNRVRREREIRREPMRNAVLVLVWWTG